MQYQQILSQIRDAFLNQDKVSGYKKVIEFFDKENKFQGDIYNFYIREVFPTGTSQYYVITSPYDISWKGAPQQALVFCEENLVYSNEFSEAVRIRTGCMDALFLKSMNINNLSDKNILIVGSGGTAKYSYLFLKDTFLDIGKVDYTNKSGSSNDFESLGNLYYVEKPDLEKYDIILLHAHVSSPYLTADSLAKIKNGAIITSYGGMTPDRDIDPLYLTSDTTVIIDMHSNTENLKPLKIALEKGYIKKDEVLDFSNLLSNGPQSNNKKFTVFISGGTYIQNLAMLKYMMSNP